MYGVVTRNPEEIAWDVFDRGCYEIKDVTGRRAEPLVDATNMISCFGDTAAGETDPDLVPVAADGSRATRDQPYFDWGYICPSSEPYREELLGIIDQAVEYSPDVRLDDIGFPRGEYCYCDRCEAAFAQSDHDDRGAWRSSAITSFISAARDRVPGHLAITVYPDPYPGHLEARSGVDLDSLEAIVDEVVVPLYDLEYGTTYWLEALAGGFASRLSGPVSIELYAVDIELTNLVKATQVADAVADTVYFGYDAGTARGAIRRIRADATEGDTYGPTAG